MKYYLTVDGEKITGPLSMAEIVDTYGTVASLEVAGFRLVQVED